MGLLVYVESLPEDSPSFIYPNLPQLLKLSMVWWPAPREGLSARAPAVLTVGLATGTPSPLQRRQALMPTPSQHFMGGLCKS